MATFLVFLLLAPTLEDACETLHTTTAPGDTMTSSLLLDDSFDLPSSHSDAFDLGLNRLKATSDPSGVRCLHMF